MVLKVQQYTGDWLFIGDVKTVHQGIHLELSKAYSDIEVGDYLIADGEGTDKVRVLEVTDDSREFVIYTDLSVYLMNNEGKTIERLN